MGKTEDGDENWNRRELASGQEKRCGGPSAETKKTERIEKVKQDENQERGTDIKR